MGRVKTPPLGGGGLACWPPGQGGAGSGSQPWPGLWQALLSTAATSVTRHPCFCLPLATTPCAHIARPHAPPGCPRGSPLLAPSSEGPRFSCHPRADSAPISSLGLHRAPDPWAHSLLRTSPARFLPGPKGDSPTTSTPPSPAPCSPTLPYLAARPEGVSSPLPLLIREEIPSLSCQAPGFQAPPPRDLSRPGPACTMLGPGFQPHSRAYFLSHLTKLFPFPRVGSSLGSAPLLPSLPSTLRTPKLRTSCLSLRCRYPSLKAECLGPGLGGGFSLSWAGL